MGTDAYNYGLDCLFHDGRYQNGENIGARMAGDIMWAGYKAVSYTHLSGSGDFFGSCTDHGAAAHSKVFGYGLDGTSCG